MPLIYVDKIERQLHLEATYSRTNIKSKVLGSILESSELTGLMETAVLLLRDYCTKEYDYPSKNSRVAQLAEVDLTELVQDIMCMIILISKPELFTSVVGRLASCLKYSDKQDAIKTLSEVLAVMAGADLFDVFSNDEGGELMIESVYAVDSQTLEFISKTQYLPPMVCKPNVLYKNSDSGYLRLKESLILGAGNYHDGDICLDSLNKFNAVALELDVRLLKMFDEEPNSIHVDSYSKEGVLVTAREKKEAFDKMKDDSAHVYAEIAAEGAFYLTHKPDKRGRTYSQGYHISTQGTKFKKAIINFAKKEIVDGAP